MGHLAYRKALRGFFSFYFQLHYLPEENCFQQAGSSVVEGTSQAVLGLVTSRRYQPACHYF
jgi:hypothetical protein